MTAPSFLAGLLSPELHRGGTPPSSPFSAVPAPSMSGVPSGNKYDVDRGTSALLAPSMRELHRLPPAGLPPLKTVWTVPDAAQLFASPHEGGGGPGALPAPPLPCHAPLGQPLACGVPGSSTQVCILVASTVQSPVPVPAGARIRNCMLWVHIDGGTALAHAALPLPTLGSALPPDGGLHPSCTFDGSGEHVRGLAWLGPPSPSGAALVNCGQYISLVTLPGTGTGTGRLSITPLLPYEPWGGAALPQGVVPGRGLYLSPGELRAVAVNPFATGIVATACQDGTVSLLAMGGEEGGETHALRVLRVLPTLARSPASDIAWSPYTPHLLAWTLDGGAVQWTRLPPVGTLPLAPAVVTLLTPGPATFALAFLDETTLILGHGSGGWQSVRLTGAELLEGKLGPWTRDPAVPEVGYVLPAPRGVGHPALQFACAGTDAVSVWRGSWEGGQAECVAFHRVSSPSAHSASLGPAPFVQLMSALPAYPWLRDAYGPPCSFPLRPRIFAAWADDNTLVTTDTSGAITVGQLEVPAGRIPTPATWASPGAGWAALLGGVSSSSEGSSRLTTAQGALTSPTRFRLPGSSSSARAVGTPRGVGGLEALGDFPPSGSSSGDSIRSPAPHSVPLGGGGPKWAHFG